MNNVFHMQLDQPLLNAKQVAEVFGVPISWVYSRTAMGELPHFRLGRYPRYDRKQVAEYLASRQHQPVPVK